MKRDYDKRGEAVRGGGQIGVVRKGGKRRSATGGQNGDGGSDRRGIVNCGGR